MPAKSLRFNWGASQVALLAGVLAVAAAGGGGWWFGQRGASSVNTDTGPAASAAPANAAGPAGSAPAGSPGAGTGGPAGAAGGPGGPGGPGGAAGNRRFAGANRVQPVTVAVVRRQDLKVVLAGIGNISALNTATVRTRVEAELKNIRFKEGQLVRAGALLAELDSRSYDIALAQAQSQLAKDQATLKNAQLDLARYKDLLGKDSIARQQVDTQEALVQQLQATLQSDQAQVDNAKLQLSYTKITAPITGRLGLKQADLGNVVRPSDVNGLVTITQTQPISVVFALPEINLPQITRKLKGTEPLMVEAWDRELRTLLATGKVNTTDNSIDPVTGTIKLKAEFANADGSLFPNQFVNVKLQVNTLEAALTVPTPAIQRGAVGTFVYVVKPDNSVAVRRVRTGATEGDWVSVNGELEAGDKVVTDGADRLREGAKVEVITPPPRFGGGAGGPGGPGGLGGPSGPGGGLGPRPGGAGGGAPGAGSAGAGAAGTGMAAGAPARPGSAPATPGARSEEGTGPRGAAGGKPDAAPTAAEASPARAGVGTPPPPSNRPAPGGPGAAPAAGGGGMAWIDQLPPEAQDRVRGIMQRLGPEVAAKVGKMSPEERRAFFQQLRAQRQQQE